MIRLIFKTALLLLAALFVYRAVAGVGHGISRQYAWMRPSKPLI